MTCILRALLAALCLLLPAAAFGQGAVLQSGPRAPGHVPQYVGSGSQAVVMDGGPAGGGGPGINPSEFALTARGTGTPPYAGQGTGPYGTNWCDYDAPTTNATGYHYLCLSANANGGALIAVGAGGTATPLPFQFFVNGSPVNFVNLWTQNGSAISNVNTGPVQISSGNLQVLPSGGQATLQIGFPSLATAPFIDFHAGSGNAGYDARLVATSNGAVSGSGTLTVQGTLAVNAVGGTAQQGVSVVQSGLATGSVAGSVAQCVQNFQPTLVYNNICVSADSANVTGSGLTFTNALNVGLVTGGANSIGTKVALQATLVHNAASNAGSRDNIALNVSALSAASEGGTNTGAGAQGTLFGVGIAATLAPGATNYFSVAGSEVDVGIQTGGSAKYRFGWSVIANGSAQATAQDIAYEVGAANGDPGFKTAFALTNLHGNAPLSSTGCVICTDGTSNTITTGIDLSPYTISGNFLKGQGFQVAGNGAITSSLSLVGAFTATFTNTHATAGDSLVVMEVGLHGSDTTSSFVSFYDATAQTVQGAIVRNGTAAVAYNTTSDARLKTALPGGTIYGIEALRRIHARDYYRNDDPDERRENGYFAQELAEIYPFAVTNGGVDPHRNPWAVDYGRITPLIVQAVQDVDARLSAIETKMKVN